MNDLYFNTVCSLYRQWLTGLCLLRYRNFRTFTSPRPTQFSSLAVDPSGDLVTAGAQDSFEVFIWSMQTGRLLEVTDPNCPTVCVDASQMAVSN